MDPTSDDAAWARLRQSLWPDCSAARHAVEREIYFRSPGIVALAVDAEDQAFGFAEVSLRRDHVPGTDASPVPFLEGWFVEAGWQRRGVGRALVDFVIAWALDHGFNEISSDTELDNTPGQAVHLKLGFEEVERTINYRLRLEN